MGVQDVPILQNSSHKSLNIIYLTVITQYLERPPQTKAKYIKPQNYAFELFIELSNIKDELKSRNPYLL